MPYDSVYSEKRPPVRCAPHGAISMVMQLR